MEARIKRVSRAAAPVEIPSPAPPAHEIPGEIIVETAVDPVVAVALSPASDSVAMHDPPLLPALPAPDAERGDLGEIGQEALAALAEYRATLARGLDALIGEMAQLARGGIDAAAHTAIEMLAVKTFSDAIAVNAGFARASFDSWIGGSAKFSELGARLAVDSSRPFLARVGKSWGPAPRIGC